MDAARGQQGGNPRPSYDLTNQSRFAAQSNGYQPVDGQSQRYPINESRDERTYNGYAGPPVDSRNGRSRDGIQNLPVRERSKTKGGPAGVPSVNKPLNGNSRICKKCGEALTGQFVRALGGTYHLECFLCQVRNRISYSHYM